MLTTESMGDSNIFTPSEIVEVVQRTGAYLLTGGYGKAGSGEGDFMTQYNSALLFDGQGILRNMYNKIKLIPSAKRFHLES